MKNIEWNSKNGHEMMKNGEWMAKMNFGWSGDWLAYWSENCTQIERLWVWFLHSPFLWRHTKESKIWNLWIPKLFFNWIHCHALRSPDGFFTRWNLLTAQMWFSLSHTHTQGHMIWTGVQLKFLAQRESHLLWTGWWCCRCHSCFRTCSLKIQQWWG